MGERLDVDLESLERVAGFVETVAQDCAAHVSTVEVDAGHPPLTAALGEFGRQWDRSGTALARTTAGLADGLRSAVLAYRAVDARLAEITAQAGAGR
jgi:hypothetical protein